MKRLKSRTVIGIIILCLGCHKGMERAAMGQKYSIFKNHCVGRTLMQFPDEFAGANIITGSFTPAMDNPLRLSFFVTVDTNTMTTENFSQHLLERRTGLKEMESETVNVLRTEQEISSTSKIYRIQRIQDAYISELHFLRAGSLVVVTVNSYENTFLVAEKRLIDLMSSFSPFDQGKSKGFCLGPFLVTGDFIVEEGEYLLRDNAGNTFETKISTFTANGPETLLLRMAGPGSLLDLFHIGHTVLRSGERTIAGMRAQEWLGWTSFGQGNDEKTFKFTSETMRRVGERSKPYIKVTFDSAQKLENGTDTKTNLSDKEAMAVWDKVLDSMRPNE